MSGTTVAIIIFLIIAVIYFFWCAIGLLKIFFRALTMRTPYSRSSNSRSYPNGADEPDGSSYAEVHGNVRLE
jgi:hypothetical protein